MGKPWIGEDVGGVEIVFSEDSGGGGEEGWEIGKGMEVWPLFWGFALGDWECAFW